MLLWTFIVLVPAHARTAEAVFVEKLLRLRGAAQIRALEREFEDLKVARRACRLQTRAQVAPLACYEALAREEKWKLVQRPRDARQSLDELCIRAAHELRVPIEAPDSPGPSPACREALRSARRIQEYRGAELVRELN